MGILTRVLRLCKADLHGVMDQIEDKQLLLNQYLREMEAGLQEKENLLNQLSRREATIRRDLELRSEEIERLEKDLALSLRKDKDDIARLLIRKHHAQTSVCDQLKQQLLELEDQRQQLEHLLNEQRLQYDQVKVKAAAFYSIEQQQAFNAAQTIRGDSGACFVISEKEVELELLRRKDALQSGGAA